MWWVLVSRLIGQTSNSTRTYSALISLHGLFMLPPSPFFCHRVDPFDVRMGLFLGPQSIIGSFFFREIHAKRRIFNNDLWVSQQTDLFTRWLPVFNLLPIHFVWENPSVHTEAVKMVVHKFRAAWRNRESDIHGIWIWDDIWILMGFNGTHSFADYPLVMWQFTIEHGPFIVDLPRNGDFL